VLGAAQLAIRG